MRGYYCVGLDNPKNGINLGSALRACGCFGATFLAYSGRRIKPGNSDVRKIHRHAPLIRTDDLHKIIPYNCVPVAVDLVEGAENLATFKHPERAMYIFGAEDATLGKRILDWCKHKVVIPAIISFNYPP